MTSCPHNSLMRCDRCSRDHDAKIIEGLREDLSVARQSLYEVVSQRNSFIAQRDALQKEQADLRLKLAVARRGLRSIARAKTTVAHEDTAEETLRRLSWHDEPDERAQEIARLTAEGKGKDAEIEALNEDMHRARAAIDSNHEDIVYDIIDLKEELAEARRLLGLAANFLAACDECWAYQPRSQAEASDLRQAMYSAALTLREALAASLPAKPSGSKENDNG